MFKPKLTMIMSALLLSTGSLPATAQDQQRSRQQTEEQEQIYGSQLMTEQERAEHRQKMRAASSVEEREQIRREHHELMQERAKVQGITLPDEPPAVRGGTNRSGDGQRGR